MNQQLHTPEESVKKEVNIFFKLYRGDFLAEDTIIKQSKLILLIIVLVLILISNGFAGARELDEIATLKDKLNDVKYENLVIKTELTMHSRQSQIEKLLDERGIDLSRPRTPAYEIKK